MNAAALIPAVFAAAQLASNSSIHRSWCASVFVPPLQAYLQNRMSGEKIKDLLEDDIEQHESILPGPGALRVTPFLDQPYPPSPLLPVLFGLVEDENVGGASEAESFA